MAPKKQPWFRFYSEAIYDPKLRSLTTDARWLFVVCLAMARQSPEPGVLLLTETMPVGITHLIDGAAMTPTRTQRALDLLASTGLVDFEKDRGAWAIPKWSDRQFDSDNRALRPSRSSDRAPYQRPMGAQTHDDRAPQNTETETETDNPPQPPRKRGGNRQQPTGVHPPVTEFCRTCNGMIPHDCSGVHAELRVVGGLA